jgi:hypothetical protein
VPFADATEAGSLLAAMGRFKNRRLLMHFTET